MGIQHFIWQERYLPMLHKLDPQNTYTIPELNKIFDYDVALQTVGEYGMGFNGRALNLLRKYGEKKQTMELLEPCPELSRTSHFHVDFLGRYISPRCTGMGILLEDIDKNLDSDKYPVMSILYEGGVQSLIDYAKKRGYKTASDGYVSKCELCFDIRKFLIIQDRQAYPDLSPESFYKQDF